MAAPDEPLPRPFPAAGKGDGDPPGAGIQVESAQTAGGALAVGGDVHDPRTI
jgi:hypothetical protein